MLQISVCDNSQDLRPAVAGRNGLGRLGSQTLPTNGKERHDSLSPSTVLRDYTIEKVIGHGGFGIVYRARHDELGLVVAIKEYLPVELAVRDGVTVRARSDADSGAYEDGLQRFREEARALIQFHDHPSIVSCREYFRANGTAYLVMEYVDGQSLAQVLAGRESERALFEESDLLAIMLPLLEGLAYVHAAWILHRDIKPSNILIRRRDGRPVLIDFGAAKQLVASRTKSMAPYTEGYAALEQVADAGELGPWTDIYGAGAVMWRMVAGGPRPWEPPNPVSVESRSHAFVRGSNDPLPSASELGRGRFSPKVLEAIDGCMTLSETERVQSCKELLRLLPTGDSNTVEEDTHAPTMSKPESTEATVPEDAVSGEGVTDGDAGTESLNLAGFASRIVATMVDIAVLVSMHFVILMLLVMVTNYDPDDAEVWMAISAIGAPCILAYQIALMTLRSTTVGGLVARIRVVRSDGASLQFADALRRAFSIALIPIVALFTGFVVALVLQVWFGLVEDTSVGFSLVAGTVVGCLGWFWPLWDPRKQALHDKMANTYVVRTCPPRDVFCPEASDQ